MKTQALQYPVFANGLDRANDPSVARAISALLPGMNAGVDTTSGDFILLDASSMTSAAPVARTERLVVLIPDNELDENDLAHRIWQMAAPGSLEVLLLSLSPEPETEAYLRFRLATLASMIRDERVRAGILLGGEETWIEAAERVWRPGDLLVCFKDQKVSSWLKAGADLGTQLSESLEAPVYFLTGLSLGPSQRQLHRRKEWIAWMGFIATLAVFGWIQIQINQAMVGKLWMFFMVTSVLVEITILWEINKRTQ